MLYEQNIEKLRTLDVEDMGMIFEGACITTLMLKSGMTILDAAMQAGCFKNTGEFFYISLYWICFDNIHYATVGAFRSRVARFFSGNFSN